jgi:hypothetical protein
VSRPPTHLAVGADVEKESKAVLICSPTVSMSARVRPSLRIRQVRIPNRTLLAASRLRTGTTLKAVGSPRDRTALNALDGAGRLTQRVKPRLKQDR